MYSGMNYQYQPYMPYQPQQMAYQQPYQQRQQGVAGRAVSSLEEITVQEVPTDGSTGFFPMMDGSCIYAKKWNQNGTIDTVRYVPEIGQHVKSQQDSMAEKVDRILQIVSGAQDES